MIKILVAVDGSALSLDAVHHVLRLVQDGLRASVVLANVQEPASLYELVVSRDPDLIAAASVEAGEHLMASARCCRRPALAAKPPWAWATRRMCWWTSSKARVATWS